jgi:hypothetical protein
MSLYYRVLFSDEGTCGLAHVASGQGFLELPEEDEVRGWRSLQLDLVAGEFVDYLANDLGCRLCSDELRRVLDASASPLDCLQWLPVAVRRGKEQRSYFILHFPHPADVLDRNMSMFAGDFAVKPVLSRAAAEGHKVFSFTKGGDLLFFVHDSVRNAIESDKLTGAVLSPAAAS